MLTGREVPWSLKLSIYSRVIAADPVENSYGDKYAIVLFSFSLDQILLKIISYIFPNLMDI
jgi:hypothetical protein